MMNESYMYRAMRKQSNHNLLLGTTNCGNLFPTSTEIRKLETCMPMTHWFQVPGGALADRLGAKNAGLSTLEYAFGSMCTFTSTHPPASPPARTLSQGHDSSLGAQCLVLLVAQCIGMAGGSNFLGRCH